MKISDKITFHEIVGPARRGINEYVARFLRGDGSAVILGCAFSNAARARIDVPIGDLLLRDGGHGLPPEEVNRALEAYIFASLESR